MRLRSRTWFALATAVTLRTLIATGVSGNSFRPRTTIIRGGRASVVRRGGGGGERVIFLSSRPTNDDEDEDGSSARVRAFSPVLSGLAPCRVALCRSWECLTSSCRVALDGSWWTRLPAPYRVAAAVPAVVVAASLAWAALRPRCAPDDDDSDDDGYGRMLRTRNPTVRAVAFWAQAGPIVAHYKFGRWWMRRRDAPLARRNEVWARLNARYAPEVYDVMIRFRGLFVKVGQVLSSRPDFMPRPYVEVMTRLQDRLPVTPFAEIRSLVEGTLSRDLGTTFDDVFATFDPVPLGTASIGQVHEATLRPELVAGTDDPVRVAVKIMHPDSEKQFENDFVIFKWLLRIALPGWAPFLDHLKRQMMTEFDYVNEAESLRCVRENMARSPYARAVKIPRPITRLCTPNLLVMEMLDGKKLSEYFVDELGVALGGDRDLAERVIRNKQNEMLMKPYEKKDETQQPTTNSTNVSERPKLQQWATALDDLLVAAGPDHPLSLSRVARLRALLRLRSLRQRVGRLLDTLLDVHGHEIFVDGLFNADPHPGNVLRLDDGRLGLIDYGQVKRVSDEDRLNLSRVVVALADGDRDGVAMAMRDLGYESRYSDPETTVLTAEFYLDSNAHGREIGVPNPQKYLQYLARRDPSTRVPPAGVMVARTSFLFRGMGTLLQRDVRTARCWSPHARKALATAERNDAERR